jgi:SAM-dependent methyltransferase
MLTVDYDRLGLRAGERLLDLGCGFGRHTFEATKIGADVVSADLATPELRQVKDLLAAMRMEGELPEHISATQTCANALTLPFPDASFDRIIASEVMEHIPDDEGAMAELQRVLKPGGTIAVTIPARFAERICWKLTDEYYAPKAEGGHVRIYQEGELRDKMVQAGLLPGDSHKAHAIHSPYWWIKCAVGIENNDHPMVKAYHRLLLWDISKAPWLTRTADKVLNPLIGKSLVVYATKPGQLADPVVSLDATEESTGLDTGDTTSPGTQEELHNVGS